MSAVIHAFPAPDAQPGVDELVEDLGVALGRARRPAIVGTPGGPAPLIAIRPDARGVVDDLALDAAGDGARRAVLALVVAVLAVVLLAAGAVMGPDGTAAAQPVGATVVVEQGETLWDIATGIVPSGQDPRPTVRIIRDLNDLGPGPLQAGTILDLPALD